MEAGYTSAQITEMDGVEFDRALKRLESKAKKQPKPKVHPVKKPRYVDLASEEQLREWLAIGRTDSRKVYYQGVSLALFRETGPKRLALLNKLADKASGTKPRKATEAEEIVWLQVTLAVIQGIDAAQKRGQVTLAVTRPPTGPGFLYIAIKRKRGAEFADSVREKMVNKHYRIQQEQQLYKNDILKVLREPEFRTLFEVSDDIAFHGNDKPELPPQCKIRYWPVGKPKQAVVFDLNLQDLGSLKKPERWKRVMRTKAKDMVKLMRHRFSELARNKKAFEDGYRSLD